jgi:lysozyme
MKLSQRGLELICSFEGYHTALPDGGCKAYLDKLAKPHIWTIGYGCTEGIYEGLVWTKEQAEAAFRRELAKHEQFVTQIVTVPLNQNEFDALVSFCYNLGPNNLRTLVANRLNKNKRMETAKAFPLYDKAGGKVYRGLVRRRYAEAALFAEAPAEELEASPHMPQVVDAAKEPMSPGAKVAIAAPAGAATVEVGKALLTPPPPAVADTVSNVSAWQGIGRASAALWAVFVEHPFLMSGVGAVAIGVLFWPQISSMFGREA